MPLYYGLLNEDFIQSIRNSNTYEESAFAREYMSKWTSASEGSLFNYDKLESLRKLKRAEWKATNITEDVYYVLSVDVARLAARTVASVLKVRRGNDRFSVNVVNIYLMEGRNFLFQAAKLKELHGAYGFNNVIIDGLGLGVGLIDFLMIETVHPETGHVYPPWNVQNVQKYKEYLPEQKIGAEALLHIIKATQHLNGVIASVTYNYLFSGRVRLLIDEKQAKDNLDKVRDKRRRPPTLQERIKLMDPYKNTSLFIAETTNLRISRTSTVFKLEKLNKSMFSDTFSSISYGLYTISEQEKEYYMNLRRKRPSLKGAIFFN